jgi:hypothetical protein
MRVGQSQALVVRGGAGIGKTALLDYLEAGAGGCRIARSAEAEAEAEMELAYAGSTSKRSGPPGSARPSNHVRLTWIFLVTGSRQICQFLWWTSQ